MDDWASKAAKKFDEEEDAKRKAEELASEKLRIFGEQGVRVWSDVRRELQGRVQRFNQEEGREVLVAPEAKQDKLTIFAKRSSGQREMTPHFDKAFPEIEFYAKDSSRELPDVQGKFGLSVTANNGLILVDSGEAERSIQYAVDQMLDALLRQGN